MPVNTDFRVDMMLAEVVEVIFTTSGYHEKYVVHNHAVDSWLCSIPKDQFQLLAMEIWVNTKSSMALFLAHSYLAVSMCVPSVEKSVVVLH